jgi:hypothetical protein
MAPPLAAVGRVPPERIRQGSAWAHTYGPGAGRPTGVEGSPAPYEAARPEAAGVQLLEGALPDTDCTNRAPAEGTQPPQRSTAGAVSGAGDRPHLGAPMHERAPRSPLREAGKSTAGATPPMHGHTRGTPPARVGAVAMGREYPEETPRSGATSGHGRRRSTRDRTRLDGHDVHDHSRAPWGKRRDLPYVSPHGLRACGPNGAAPDRCGGRGQAVSFTTDRFLVAPRRMFSREHW